MCFKHCDQKEEILNLMNYKTFRRISELRFSKYSVYKRKINYNFANHIKSITL